MSGIGMLSSRGVDGVCAGSKDAKGEGEGEGASKGPGQRSIEGGGLDLGIEWIRYEGDQCIRGAVSWAGTLAWKDPCRVHGGKR